SKDPKRYGKQSKREQSEPQDIAPDHPFEMLFDHMPVNGDRGETRRDDPRQRHCRQTHSKYPAEIRVLSQVQTSSRAAQNAKHIRGADEAVSEDLPPVQSQAKLQRT